MARWPGDLCGAKATSLSSTENHAAPAVGAMFSRRRISETSINSTRSSSSTVEKTLQFRRSDGQEYVFRMVTLSGRGQCGAKHLDLGKSGILVFEINSLTRF